MQLREIRARSVRVQRFYIQPSCHQRVENLPQFVFLEHAKQRGGLFVCGSPRKSRFNRFGLQRGGQSLFEDFKGGIESSLGGMGAQDFGAEAMNGANAGRV